MHTDNDHNLEQLRADWQKLNLHMEDLERRNRKLEEMVRCSNFSTPQNRLIRHYRVFIIVSFLCAFYVPWFLIADLAAPVWFSIACCVYFLVMGALHAYTLRKIERVNFGTMDLRRASEAIYDIKITRISSLIIGLILCLPIIGYLMWFASRFSVYAFYGCCVGFIIGLIIAIASQLKSAAWLRSMRHTINELKSSEE